MQKNVTDSRRFVKFLVEGQDHKSALLNLSFHYQGMHWLQARQEWRESVCLVVSSSHQLQSIRIFLEPFPKDFFEFFSEFRFGLINLLAI